MTHLSRSLVLGASILALAACGPEDLGSPGVNGDINIGDINVDNSNNSGSSGGGGGGTVTPAANCPDLGTADTLTDGGTITGPEGEWLVCTLPAIFTEDATLPYAPGVLYELNGRVDVGADDGATADNSDGITGTPVTLTINDGVILFGRKGVSGGSYMVVQRGSKLNANGTAARPIVFTGEDNVTGRANNSTSALWGGVVLLGRAPVADCAVGGLNPVDPATCTMSIEGIANNVPVFGGNTPDDSSGEMHYVQIRYSGFTLDLGSELQSLTLGGIGSGTVLDHIQSFNSSDDGTEFFGGHVNMSYFVAVGAEDDSIDTDSGVQANLQNVIVVQRDGVGDKALENDSPENDKGPNTTQLNAGPRTLTQVSNFSFWSTSTGSTVQTRGASDLTLANGVIYKPSSTGKACVDNNGDQSAAPLTVRGSTITLYSVELDCDTNAATDAAVANGSDNVFQTNTLTDKYINGASEDGFTPLFDVTGLSTFFTASTFAGAVTSSNNWATGWTCDSPTVSFGSGESCLALPVY